MKRLLLAFFSTMAAVVVTATPLHSEYRNAAYIYGPYANGNGGTQVLGTNGPYLAFPGAQLDEMVKTTLWATGAGNPNGAQMRSYFTHPFYGEDGRLKHIIFPVFTIASNGGYYKGVIIKLTQGAGGVMAEALAAKYWAPGTGAPSAFDPISSFDASGNPSGYKSGVTNNNIYNGSTGNYGVRGLMAMTVAPNVGDGAIRIFANQPGEPALTLDDLADFSFDAIMIGGAITTPNNGYVRIAPRDIYKLYDEDTGACTNMQFAVQALNDANKFVKCAIINLTNGEDGVYCYQWRTCYVAGSNGANYQFLTDSWTARNVSSGTTGGGGSPYNGYSIAGLRAKWNGGTVAEPTARPIYELGIKPVTYGARTDSTPSATVPMITSQCRLAFPGAKLEDLEGDDVFFAGYMTSGGSLEKGPGRSYYKQSYREGGKLKFIVSTIMHPDDKFVKAAVFKLTQGADGVYLEGIGARYRSSGSLANAKAQIASTVFTSIGADGTITFLENPSGLAESASANGYGACSIQAMKSLSTADRLAFANGENEPVLTVDDLKDYFFTARPIGNSYTSGLQGIATLPERNRRMFVDEDTGKVTNIVFETSLHNDVYFKNCVVMLSNGANGVNARLFKTGAWSQSGHTFGETVLNDDLTCKQGVITSAVGITAPWEAGYGLCFLRAVPKELVDVAIWTGKVDNDRTKYQNWFCMNSGAELPGRVPSAVSTVRMEGPVSGFQVPVGTVCPGKGYEIGSVLLKNDIDWRGMTNAVLAAEVTIDLGGHALDLMYLTGWGTVKNGTLRLDTPADTTNELNGVAITTALVKNGEGTLRIVKSGYSLPSVNVAAGTLEMVAGMTTPTLTVSGAGAGEGVITVTDTYKPLSTAVQPKVQLNNGTKLDLSGLSGSFDATKVTYAANASVQLKLGTRAVHVGDWLVRWEQQPAGITFTSDNQKVERSLLATNRGIVVHGGLTIIIR